MKLKMLRECVNTGAIAVMPTALQARTKLKRTTKKRQDRETFPITDGYLGLTSAKQPKLKKTTAIQPSRSTKTKHWYDNFAQKPNQDSRLLPQFRGKGY